MFGIGFFEIMLVIIIALVVFGPDRLPELVRFFAIWTGRLKRKYAEIHKEIEEQIGADEIRQTLHNEQILHELKQAGYDEQGNPSADIAENAEYKNHGDKKG